MPEQDWNGFPDDTTFADTDVLLAARGAGGVNVPASSLLRKGASGVFTVPDNGFDEKIRLVGVNRFFSFYNVGETTRQGYMGQFGLDQYYWNDSNGATIFGNNNIEGARFDPNRNFMIGISTALAASKLSVQQQGAAGVPVMSLAHTAASGTRYFAAFYKVGGVEVGNITTNGTTTTYGTSSDYRLKENIVDLEDSGDLIDALRPRRGNWKEDGSDFVGFLAHEFAEVFPASVQGVKDETEIRTVVDEGTGEETEVEVPRMQSMQASSSEVMAVVIAELQSVRRRLAEAEAKIELLSQ